MKHETITLESLQELVQEQAEIIAQKDKVIAQLQEKIDYLIRKRFTSSSERFPANHPSLFDDLFDTTGMEEATPKEEAEENKPARPRRRKGGRTTPPESLPRVRIEHDLGEEEKVCSCGCAMQRIKEEVSYQYDVIPARFQVIENVRFVYGCSCRCGSKVVTSPLSPQVLPRHQVTPSLLATIAIQKFEDALPLERQAKIFTHRFGVPFTGTTLSAWMIKTAALRLQPLIDRLRALQNRSGYIQADETTLQVLNEPGKKAQSKSYVWLKVSHAPYPIVMMHYADNRAGATAQFLFQDFEGYLQTDGYSGYNPVANREGVTQLGCWAHARRKFADIIKSGSSDALSKTYAKEAVALIGKLYKVEREIKDKPPDEKRTIRAEQSHPIIEQIRTWLDDRFFAAHKQGGAIARAFTYLNNQFSKLTVYLKDGRLAIDNNAAENHVRPIALGRKNWLFATSVEGAKALAHWYSVIETAKANGVEPFAYVEHLLTHMPLYQAEGKEIDPLLPWNVTLG